MLIMNLSHYIDLVRYIGAVEVESIVGLTAAMDADSEVEDTVSLAARFSNGAVGSIVGSSEVRGVTTTEFRLWGADGHIVIEPQPRFFTLRAVEDLRTGRWQTFGRLPRRNLRQIFLSRLATALDQDRDVDVSGRDGVAVQAIIEAAYVAAEQHTSVRPADLIQARERVGVSR